MSSRGSVHQRHPTCSGCLPDKVMVCPLLDRQILIDGAREGLHRDLVQGRNADFLGAASAVGYHKFSAIAGSQKCCRQQP